LGYDSTTNDLKTITLASNETITYLANDTARTQTQTTSTGLSTVTQFNAEGGIQSVTDNTGTTSYRYDTVGRVAGIDMPNGASVSYTYDILGRVKTLTEKASITGVEYRTEYDYDTFGNLIRVKDPAQGITTMKYDTLNRLTERNLPNGMKTNWGYDALDRIETVSHKDAQGSVISSVTYERKASGEPLKITREDGTYTKLQYDSALRVTNEQFYSAQNVLMDERTYVYDEDGKRIATITSASTRTYNYTAGYQLDSITATGINEDYDYDVNGRMDLIARDGQTLDLDHDVYDRLTAAKNLTSGTTTNYIYDGAGRRVKATSAGNERYFLVTPASGSGLDSTDLMFDQGGNITANYVYAGGYSPFMKLDANGNPVYYLTDGMGSVIGMANQSGQSVAKFNYDSFGNIRSQSGSLADTAGGDFRFQGQWLESATGIYHFRARDYDSKTGTFLSRDPVDPDSQQPEAMNPYQAMYNNPYVYSDPTGMITMSEVIAKFQVEKAIQKAQTYAFNQVRETALDKARGIAGQVVQSVLDSILPFNVFQAATPFNYVTGDNFAQIIQNTICEVIGANYVSFFDNLHFETSIEPNGEPISDGFSCGPLPSSSWFLKKENVLEAFDGKVAPRPDLVIKKGGPESTDRKPPAYLIVEVTRSVTNILSKSSQQKRQWNAIANYPEFLTKE
jgi:RHS repeat-associated protein